MRPVKTSLRKRNIAFLAGMGCLVVQLTNCSETPDVPGSDAAALVEASEIAFAKTMEERDFEAFLEFVSPEAVFFNGKEALRGHQEISRVWAPFFEDDTAPFSWEPDLTEVLESGELALSSGPVRNSGGEIIGRFNSIWRLDRDGRWRVIFDKGS